MLRTVWARKSAASRCGWPTRLPKWSGVPAAEDNPATAHMFIVNPLHARAVDALFSTHPNTANRIAALCEIAGLQAAEPERRGPWG